jgi:hypothetical protein
MPQAAVWAPAQKATPQTGLIGSQNGGIMTEAATSTMLAESNLLYHVQPQQLTLVRPLNIRVQVYTNVVNCVVQTASCSPPGHQCWARPSSAWQSCVPYCRLRNI